MNESFGGGFDTTQNNAGGVPAEKKAEGVVPMVIRQVLQSGDDGLALCGNRFASVSLVAIMRSSEPTSTKITYQLEDHTGRISAHYWLEEGDSIHAPQVPINSYVRVYGSARSTEGRKTIMIFRLEPLPNVNELTNHLLEVLHTRYRAEELSRVTGKTGGFGSDFSAGIRAGQFGAAGGDGGVQSAPSGLDAKQQLVYDAIKRHRTEEGISISELKKKFEHMSPAEVNKITDWLTSEGHIYTSIDSEHFLTTDG